MAAPLRATRKLAVVLAACLPCALTVQVGHASATSGFSCTSASLISDMASPQPSGTVVHFTAAPGGAACTNPRFEFWLYEPATGFRIVQAYSSAATFPLDTSLLVPGTTYSIDVWVEQSGSPVGPGGYETFGLEAWTVIDGCSSASVSVATTGGYNWNVTASAGGFVCTAPQFEFWLWQPFGGWTLAQPYSFSSSWSYSNPYLPPGGFTVDVWVRQSGSTAEYEAFALGVLPSSTCEPINVFPGMGNANGVIIITATPNAMGGCPPGLMYQFWVYLPGSGWQLVQDYSSSNTASWNAAGLYNGTYSISVLVRLPPAYNYIFYGLGTYQVSGCPNVGIGPSPASPQSAGTAVSFGASSPCGALYQFWVYKPGGPWTVVQNWSMSSSYAWTTTGLAAGTYAWTVYAKLPTSAQGFDAFAVTAYSLT